MNANRFACTVFLCATLVGLAAPAGAQTPTATRGRAVVPVRARMPAMSAGEYDGAAALGLALRRIGVTGRVLMIGAHPDDENTALLAALALERGLDVAYLSLTRGEGGQNGIGPELGAALGLLRSEELLAARRLDGARQFFTRAYDFGYSKSAEEAFRHWPREALLRDVVAVIRTFRPDAIVSIFTGTPRDGHGHHQAAGIMARLAFEAAGDPERFPEQIERGLRPHVPAALYQALWRSDSGDLQVATGAFDPLLGRSAYQVAMASRSRHRSQDMGQDQPPGPHETWLDRITVVETDAVDPLRAGAATTLAARARSLTGAGEEAGGRAHTDLLDVLSAYDAEADALRGGFNALAPNALVPGLARALGLLRRAGKLLDLLPADAAPGLRRHIAGEVEDVAAALARASGLTLDAVAEDERVVPGQVFELELTLWNGGVSPVTITALTPALPDGWQATPLDPQAQTQPLAPGMLVTRRFRVQVPTDAVPTEPYFLRRPRAGDLYVWPGREGIVGLSGNAPGKAVGAAPSAVAVPAELLERGRRGVARQAPRGAPSASVLLGQPAPIDQPRPLGTPGRTAVDAPAGRPFDAAPVRALARIELAGATFALAGEATYRDVDPQRGELRRPVYVVPRVSVALEPGVAVLPLNDATTTTDGTTGAASVRTSSRAPAGMRASAAARKTTGITDDAVAPAIGSAPVTSETGSLTSTAAFATTNPGPIRSNALLPRTNPASTTGTAARGSRNRVRIASSQALARGIPAPAAANTVFATRTGVPTAGIADSRNGDATHDGAQPSAGRPHEGTRPTGAADASAPRSLRFTVRLTAEAPDGLSGTLALELPEGWTAQPASVPVRFDAPGAQRVLEFTVHPAAATTPGEYPVRAVFVAEDGQRFGRGYAFVDYPHIRPRPIYRAAESAVRALDVQVPPDLRVAYITGVGDDGPAAIRQLGLTVDLLDAAALAAADLGAYDVIVTGIRAYEVRPDLVAHNRRLLAYVEDGGTLVVQYNKYAFDEGDFAPYPLTMARPHDRVTDEGAPVEFIAPEHPVLTKPNQITAADFEGWVQDLGLYFAHTWDEQYTPVLSMADPGEAPLEGGLLVASYGEGTYVYTGLAFFRQFPAGVPGAYRLFANLLALGAQ